MTFLRTFFKIGTGIVLGTVCAMANANAVIDIVVPNPPGGTTDMVGRHISKILTDADIANVILNKPGAQGTIGTKFAATVDNKNSTLLILGTGPGMYAPLTLTSPPYNVLQDFEFIVAVATDPIVAIVPGHSGIDSISKLTKSLHNSQSQLRWGHGATSQRFAGVTFLSKINATGVEVPYNGANKVVMDIAGGHLDVAFVNYTEAKEMAKNNRIKIIAIATDQRHPHALDIKTFREQGVNFEMQAWFVVVGPRGISPLLITKINQAVVKFTQQDQNSWVATNMNVIVGTPAQARNFVKEQYQQHQTSIKKLQQQ